MFKPVNRYIEIKVLDAAEEKTPSGVLLPADYKEEEETQYVTAQVISWAKDVRFEEQLSEGSHIIVDRSMIEDIDLGARTVVVVLDNYVLGLIN